MTEKFADVLTFIWGCVLAAAIGCAAYPHSALSAPVPIWAAFNLENSELPDDRAGPGHDGRIQDVFER